MKKLSDAKRSTIISLLDDGLSARQIAPRVNVNYSTIDKIQIGESKQRLTAHDKKHIIHIWRSEDDEDAMQIACKLWEDTGKDFSHDTIKYTLKEASLVSGDKKKKLALLE